MNGRRKFSIFISSTYEDLKDERQALIGVALENNFIPVGMEQFHAAPTSQWNVITKMIDECDFYMLVIGGRYGSIDEETNISYTEKEYNYAKSKKMPVLVLIKDSSSISENNIDVGDKKYIKMKCLDAFREKVKNDKNTVDFFTDLSSLKYAASSTFRNAVEYVDESIGWVRYRDVLDVINEEAEGRNRVNAEQLEYQQELLDDLKNMLTLFGNRLADIEKNNLTWEKIPIATNSDIERLFHVEKEAVVEDIEEIVKNHLDSVLLLVYAADGDGKIIKIETLSTPTQILASCKQFLGDNSEKESARWVEALNWLLIRGWVKTIGYKGKLFELTKTGYSIANLLKVRKGIDTSKDPLDEIKRFVD